MSDGWEVKQMTTGPGLTAKQVRYQHDMICGLCNTKVEPLDAHMGYIDGKLDVYHIDCWNKHLKD